MGRIAAGWVIAAMADVEAWRDRAVRLTPRKAMRDCVFGKARSGRKLGILEASIPLRADRVLVDPTSGGVRHAQISVQRHVVSLPVSLAEGY